jgi:hypothetical protein
MKFVFYQEVMRWSVTLEKLLEDSRRYEIGDSYSD